VKFTLLVCEICCSQDFRVAWTHSLTYSLTPRQTDPITECPGAFFQRWLQFVSCHNMAKVTTRALLTWCHMLLRYGVAFNVRLDV